MSEKSKARSRRETCYFIIKQLKIFNAFVFLQKPYNYFMKSYTEYLTLRTDERYQIVNITPQVQQALQKSGVKEGLCLVNSMHITSSVFINDNERGLHKDFIRWVEKLAPYDINGYQHNLTGEDNGDAHLKRTIMGREVVIAITQGQLDFGPWEEIFYGEFDGQRNKRVLIKIIGERYETQSILLRYRLRRRCLLRQLP